MDKYQFEAYWQARLAFLGAGNVRIRTEKLGLSVRVHLSQVVMPTWGVYGVNTIPSAIRLAPKSYILGPTNLRAG